MKVSEVLDILNKCDPDASVGVDVDGGIFALEFIWEDQDGTVVLCCEEVEEIKEDDKSVNECGEKCNLHNEVAEI